MKEVFVDSNRAGIKPDKDLKDNTEFLRLSIDPFEIKRPECKGMNSACEHSRHNLFKRESNALI